MSGQALTGQAWNALFLEARTANGWRDRPVSDDILKEIHDMMRWGPTSANSCPLRIVFIKTPRGKERLKPFLDKGNVEKTMAAPVTALFAYDTEFYERLPFLFPHTDARSWFVGKEEKIFDTAFRNGTLQAAYFMIVARGFGLDCGPMSGFDKEKADREFFPDGRFKSNFLCSLGYADPAKNHPRGPRFEFDDVCSIV